MKTASLYACAALAIAGANWAALPANAANATQQACSQQYQAAKTAGTLNGQKWSDFYSSCAANLKSAATPTAATAPVVAAAPIASTTTKKTAKATPVAATPLANASATSGQTSQQICSGQYQAAKTAGTLNGQKWPAFYSDCAANIRNYSETSAAAPAEPAVVAKSQIKTASIAAAPVATTDANGKPLSAGEIAFRQRIHACSAEWQSEKSAGTLPAGSKWPQFWSACNTQLKAQG